jgi:hypothetical protein
MNYVKIEWRSDESEVPVETHGEMDGERWGHRKMEIFRDGRLDFASIDEEVGGSILAEKLWPDLAELDAQSEFDVF